MKKIKNQLKKFYITNKYNSHMYKGLIGKFMRISHEKMERCLIKKSKVLEIGSGTMPHIKYLKHDFNKYYIIDLFAELKNFFKKDKRIIFKVYNGKKIPYPNNFFDRIIISHCLEHIPEPEKFLIEMKKKIKKNGNITIAIPNDPGFLWRLGKFISANFLINNNYNFSKEFYYYFTAKDHVNSIFGLIPIIKKNFKNINFESYEPFKIKVIDLNLFYIIDVKK